MNRRPTGQRLLLLILIAISATVVTIDFRNNPEGPVRKVQQFALSVVAPLQEGITTVFRPVGNFLSSIGDLGGLRRENAKLLEENEELKGQLRRFPEVERENRRLLDLLEEKDWTQGKTAGARVIGFSPSNQEWAVTLNKGTTHGLAENQSVVNSEGLVGRIIEATDSYSKVLLLIDTDHAVGARLTGSGETGVISGRGGEELRFDFIDPVTKISDGEVVVTSGFDRGIYPPGIPLGRVERTRESSGGLELIAFVRPFVDFGRLDHVLVLLDSGVAVPPAA